MAHSTGSRRGTAAKLDRTVPLAYSPVTTSTRAKLDLPHSDTDHRRVLAVLAFLRG